MGLFKERVKLITASLWVFVIIGLSLSFTETALLVIETMVPPSVIPLEKKSSEIFSRSNSVSLSSLKLFGNIKEPSMKISQIEAPTTSLNFELQGIFVARDSDQSTVIIGENKKKGKLFSVGDNIFGKGQIISISENYVLIARNGRREKLIFSDDKFRIRDSISEISKNANQIMVEGSIRGIDIKNSADRDEKADKNPGQSRIESIRAKFLTNPEEALSAFGVKSLKKEGLNGYQIDENTDQRIRQAGLQNGDLVLSINGQSLDNGLSETDIAKQVMASKTMRVEVQRGDRRFFLTIPFPG